MPIIASNFKTNHTRKSTSLFVEKLNEYLLKLTEDNDIKLKEKFKLQDELLEEKERQEYDRLALKFNKNGNLQ